MVSADKVKNVAKKHVKKAIKAKILVGGTVTLLPILMLVMIIGLMFFGFSDDEAKASEDPYAQECAATGVMTGITFGGQMDLVLRTMRIVESGENYTSQSKYSTASGVYQFINSTWNTPENKAIWSAQGAFPRAYLAPPSVQDMVAKHKVEQIIASNGVESVGPTWLLGHVPKGAEWDKKIGVNPTPRQYQAKWMKIYNFLVAAQGTNGGGSAAVATGGTNAPISADAAERQAKARNKANPEDSVAINQMYIGQASTYGNDPVTGYVDAGDNNLPKLGGASNNNPGIAIYNNGTLGGYWYVTSPNGRAGVLQQTDFGPSTSRMIDINAVAARSVFGYPAASFPTDQGIWTATYLGPTKPPTAIDADTKGTGDTAIDYGLAEPIPLTCNAASPGTEDGTVVIDANLPTGPVASTEIVNVSGIKIHMSIANNLQSMLDAMKAAGLSPGGGGYRDPAGQLAVRRSNCGSSNYAIYDKPSSSCSPPTAKPGTSMHEKGLAIDFTCGGKGTLTRSSPCYTWLKINAANFGFINFPKEAWHWSTNGH